MKIIRCKFRCIEVTKTSYGTERVKLAPVYGDSDENKKFWKATPTGAIDLSIDNGDAHNQFQICREYYVDFTDVT
jgi:S-adenosylmethionine hydrolase